MSVTSVRGKVSGRTVQVAIEGVMSVFRGRMRDMLNENGIKEPDPDPNGWYELCDFLAVLEDVEQNTGENALTKVGQATPDFVDWPSDPETPHEALPQITDVYEAEHRSATGSYDYQRTGDKAAQITVDTPYPCAFDKGLITGTAEYFGASYARIDHVETCRKDGADACVYEVTW